MWFLFQQPDEFLDRFNEERRRSERIAQLTRALRGSTPPFDAPLQRRLTDAMARTEPPSSGQLAAERS
jgi:hypothetical protein